MKNCIFENGKNIIDTISYVQENQTNSLPKNFSGKYYQIKINETGEIVDVYETSYEIKLCLANGEVQRKKGNFDGLLHEAIGLVKVLGKQLAKLVVDEAYQSYKLGDFLVKNAVEKMGCTWLTCWGTKAYKLYKKYGFVPIFSESKKRVEEEKKYYVKNGNLKKGKLDNIVEMIQKNALNSYGLDYDKDVKWFEEYCDKNYKGIYDSKPKIYNIGDIVNFKDGRTGIVEDYDDEYYYIKDNNNNALKLIKPRNLDKLFKSKKLYNLLKENISGYSYNSQLCHEVCNYIYNNVLTNEERNLCKIVLCPLVYTKSLEADLYPITSYGHYVILYNEKLYGFTDDQFCNNIHIKIKPLNDVRVYKKISDNVYNNDNLYIEL